MIESKEFYDLMAIFENTIGKGYRLDKEEKSLWRRGRYYENGQANELFAAFFAGYQFAKSLARQDALNLKG
jgi:hypothetical protein